jgi:hypothetical protein
MKILWITTFRSFGISSKNDNVQKKFLRSLEDLKQDITLAVTIFNEKNIKKNINKFKFKKKFFVNKKKLPHKSRYSQSISMENALNLCDKKKFELIVWSTADLQVPKNFIVKIKKEINYENCSTVFPLHYVDSEGKIELYPSNYGLDIFIFRIKDDKKIILLKKLIMQCPNYDWGCYEHFLTSVSDILSIKKVNIQEDLVLKKFNNDRVTFNETRNKEIRSWRINQKYLIKYLKKNKLSILYANGSIYYLIYKFFSFTSLNWKLSIIYIKLLFKLIKVLIIKIKSNLLQKIYN